VLHIVSLSFVKFLICGLAIVSVGVPQKFYKERGLTDGRESHKILNRGRDPQKVTFWRL